MKKKNRILGEKEDLKKRRDKIVSGGKEKIFDGNGGRNGWMRKKRRKKKVDMMYGNLLNKNYNYVKI